MKQTLPVLAHFEKSSDEIAKYFALKYGNNYHIIKQLQNQRKQLETPMLEAKRTLRTIEQECDGLKRSNSKQSERMKATSTFNFSRPGSQFDTFIQSTQHFDLNSGQLLFQNIKQIMESLQNKEDPPNFQLYWESVYMFKWEQYIYCFVRPLTQKIIQESIFLSDIVYLRYLNQTYLNYNFIYLMLNERKFTKQQFLRVSIRNVKNFCYFLKKILTQTKQQNALVTQLQTKIELILCKNNPCVIFIQELKKNNSFIKNIIEKVLQNDNPNIQPVIITCRYQLSQIKSLDIQTSRPQLVNAIYLSTSVSQQTEQYQSPLKTLFKIPHQQQYAMHLRQSYSNLEPVEVPFIKTPFQHSLCVILDLDETLGHYNDKIGKFIQRPGLIELLQGIKEQCEIVIFTAGLQSYADHIIAELQCDEYIDYRLYRPHTTFNGNNFVKDISKVGRPLERTIIVDNTPTNYEQQQDNGLLVSTWIDQEEDKELFELKDLIIRIAQAKTKDVRKALKKYRDYISRHK